MLILPLALLCALTMRADLGIQTPAPTALTQDGVSVTYLGGEGVLLRGGQDAVLIDALHGPHSGYEAPPPAVLHQLIRGEAPYDGVTLVLVSHVHADHFDAEMVAKHLESNPRAIFASSEQAAAAVRVRLGDSKATARVTSVPVQPGTSISMEFGRVRVRFLGLPHDGQAGPRPWNELMNLGHIVEIGGKRLLHVGDAQMSRPVFEPFRLVESKIDVAMLPAWYLGYASGHRVIEAIQPSRLVAVHLEETHNEELMAKVRTAFPDAAVPDRIGWSLTVR